jgi:hypothetical protein
MLGFDYAGHILAWNNKMGLAHIALEVKFVELLEFHKLKASKVNWQAFMLLLSIVEVESWLYACLVCFSVGKVSFL